ncbi:MAG: MFS transporter [Acidimicrobiia bacterium]
MTTQRFRFGRLWLASVSSNLGDGLVLAAFPLLAANFTDDPIAISLLTATMGLPWLVLGPISGAIVDRYDRRLLMVAFDTVRATCLALFALALVAGTESLWLLYVVVFLIAAGETVVDTSAQSLLPALIPKDKLDRANGQLFSTMTIANRFIGPPLGGLLFGVSVVAPVIADSTSFAIAALLIFSLSGRYSASSKDERALQSVTASVVEGLRWLWSHRAIRTFAIGAALLNIGIVAGEAILVLFATEQLSLGGVGFGALFAATAAGYAMGSAIAPPIAARANRLTIVGSSVVGIAISLGIVAVASHWAVAASGLFGVGLATGLWDVIAVSFRQAAVPDRLLGRIMAAYRVIAHGSIPVGALLGGIAARIWGNRAAFWVGSGVVLLAVVFVVVNLRGVELDPAKVDDATNTG